METFLQRRIFLCSVAYLISTVSPLYAHSPWGQYQVYRRKHLLLLSSRDDELSYPFSKELVACLDNVLPIAKARPARAINIERAFELLRTDQFQFAVFDRENIDKMRNATGEFSDRAPVDLGTLLQFGDLHMVVRRDFPDDLVATVTHNLIKCRNKLSIPLNLKPQILDDPNLHQGAKEAIKDFLSHS